MPGCNRTLAGPHPAARGAPDRPPHRNRAPGVARTNGGPAEPCEPAVGQPGVLTLLALGRLLAAFATAGRGHVDRRSVRHGLRLRLTAEGELGLVDGRVGLAVPALDVDHDDLARLDLAEQ